MSIKTDKPCKTHVVSAIIRKVRELSPSVSKAYSTDSDLQKLCRDPELKEACLARWKR
jgi:hypothetical protein